MPATLSHPGVYIEEIPSGVRTITGVATSITAFVGRTPSGPQDEPVVIHNYGDFERVFGKLDPDYPLAYAVRDFYLNGGATAVVVRLYKAKDGETIKSHATLKPAGLPLKAASPGTWANRLRVRVDHTVSPEVAARYKLDKADLFNLTIRDGAIGATETFLNLSVKESPRRVDRVLAAESALLRVDGLTLPGTKVPDKHKDADKDVWTDVAQSPPVKEPDDLASDSAALDQKAYEGDPVAGTGIHALKRTDLFNLLVIPPDTREGDVPYWLIPARVASGKVEWPQQDGEAVLLPARGIRHHYAPLVSSARTMASSRSIPAAASSALCGSARKRSDQARPCSI